MTRGTPLLLASALLFAPAGPGLAAQDAPPDFRSEFLGQFDGSAEKLVSLARAMPADAYDWRPMDGVASVADAFMHIARYNYYYPDVALGVDPPEGIDYERLEGVVTAKEEVVPILEASMEHVRTHVRSMSETDLGASTRLYGREVGEWAVLLQLVAHMNEHLGQEIAYARMNRVVPPWSR